MYDTDESSNLIQQKIADRYQCLEKIGAGGMGVVYLAQDILLGRKVVVKILKPSEKQEQYARRFFREAKILSQLNNEHIVSIFDFGTWQGITYIIMEYLDGRTLKQIIQTEAPLQTERVLQLLEQIMAALEAAHREGVIHRDLKPGNIFCISTPVKAEFIKILDFGLAVSLFQDESERMTRSGEILGTPHYMSPEQIMTMKEISASSDIYSLGVILYEMLSGDVPYQGTNTMEVFLGHLYKTPSPIDLEHDQSDSTRQRLIQAVEGCLKKNQSDRYTSIADVRSFLTTDQAVPVRIPENITSERKERFKQFFIDQITEIYEGKPELLSLQNKDLLLLHDDSLPLDESLVPLLNTILQEVEVCSVSNWSVRMEQALADLVILNCQPQQNLSLIQQIQHSDRWLTVPVLVCGPEDDLDFIARVIDSGAHDYLSFPYDPLDFMKKIRRILSQPQE